MSGLVAAHQDTIDPNAIAEGGQLEDKIMVEQRKKQRAIGYSQPAASAENVSSGGLSGYKVTADQVDLARPIVQVNRDNALRSVIEARQGLQTFGNFTTTDPYDEMVEIMKGVVDADGMIPGVGKVLVTPDHPYWDYAARKKAQEFHDNFKLFMYSQIDLSRPESRAYWEARFPEFTKSLRTGLKQNRMLRAEMEDIGLYGVQSERDMWLLYMKEKGVSNDEKNMTRVEVGGGLRGYRQNEMGNAPPATTLPPVLGNIASYLRQLFGSETNAVDRDRNDNLWPTPLAGPPGQGGAGPALFSLPPSQ